MRLARREQSASSLDGRVAIVTDGGRDIGRACALDLASRGASVVINFNLSSAGAKSAVEEIVDNGGQAIAIQGDMAVDRDVSALLSAAHQCFGKKIDILVHVTDGLLDQTNFS